VVSFHTKAHSALLISGLSMYKLPLMSTLPVNWCVSSKLSPNFVEPDWNMIEADINSV
jgi:hypothetical protein